MTDLSSSLHDLEGTRPVPLPFDSRLVRTCEALRSKPLQDLTIEDLRILIGQGIGLRWLLPLALDRLAADPLAEGDYYPGDLLKSVLGVEPEAWRAAPDLRTRLGPILAGARKRLAEDPVPTESLRKAIEAFERTA